MLELINLSKTYDLKGSTVDALKGITLRFRRSEFVSILGPSGCGKTTLLNLVGGLDRYTGGDLIIDGVSTKDFKDRDWDNYRNHRVGFVFQSYNLIPHQSVLENVELALTLSGIKKSERRKRAIEALTEVGLKDRLKSKPSQLSGGQMQRVAIARALVNNPEIILADEPTGALDSKTSVQIMELLKKVSKNKLVIMVTHNPGLAKKYSNRIIRLLDGELIEDNKPYSETACAREIAKHKREKERQELDEIDQELEKINAKLNKKEKKKDSNLTTEQILSTSSNQNENEIEKTSPHIEDEKARKQKVKLKKKKKEKTSMSFFTSLALSFKNLISKKGRTIMVAIAGSIGIIGIALISAVSAGMTNYINNMQSQSLSSYPVSVLYMAIDTNQVMNAVTGGDGDGEQTATDDNLIPTYDPTTQIMSLGSYNYISSDFVNYVEDYYSNEEKRALLNDYQITYASDMRLIKYNPDYAVQGVDAMAYVPINSSMTARALSGSISSTFFKELDKDYVLSMYDMIGEGAYYPEEENEVALVLNNSPTSISTLYGLGLVADKTATEVNASDFINQEYRLLFNNAYYQISEGGNISAKVDFNNINYPACLTEQTSYYYTNYLPRAQALYQDANGMNLKITCVLTLKEDSTGSIFSDGIMYTNELSEMYRQNCKDSDVVAQIYDNYFTLDAETGEYKFDETKASLEFDLPYKVNISELNTYFQGENYLFNHTSPFGMLDTLKNNYELNLTYEEIMEIYLQTYGASDVPICMSFYAKTFDGKDDLQAMINTYNETAEFKIVSSDTSQVLTNMLRELVNIVSYVLMAFAGISLLVSSIMISIITYTSVIERTKEIGVLRSIGASKKDIFWVFTAETVIIGFVSGVFGIAVSGLLSIVINVVLQHLTGVASLATLEPLTSLILVVISVALTFTAGLIPARIATKKDPVKALRTE